MSIIAIRYRGFYASLIFIGLLSGCGGSSNNTNNGGSTDVEQPGQYTVTAVASDGGNISPSSINVVEGDTASFTISTDDGYQIASVSGCNGSLDGNTFTTGAINANCSINVSFSLLQFTINAQTSNGGTVTPNEQTVDFGQSATFDLNADDDYRLVSATGCDGTISDSQYIITNVQNDCTFQVNYELQPLVLSQIYDDIHEFFDDTIVPEHEYGGTIFPEGLISYQGQGRTADLWWDSQPDTIFSLAKGYSAGIDTRVKPYLFQNIDGRMIYTEEADFPTTNGARRWATFGEEANDTSQGIFYVGHKAGEIHGRALLIKSGPVPTNITNELPAFPLVNMTGNSYDVNAHSMAGGDVNGDGRTDFVVGDWRV